MTPNNNLGSNGFETNWDFMVLEEFSTTVTPY